MPEDAVSVVAAIERNVGELLDHLPLAAPTATLATFAASALLKFIKVGQDIQALEEKKQRELRDTLQRQIRPTLRTVVEPDIELRRDVERFYILNGHVNPELRRDPFSALLIAFGDEIQLLAADRRNEPRFRDALQDLTFVYLFLRPAITKVPPAFQDPLLQRFFGQDVATREPLRLRGILATVREGGFEQYDQTPAWYQANIDRFLYWQLASCSSLQLSENAQARIKQELTNEVRALYVNAIFGEGGLLDSTRAMLDALKASKKAEAQAKVGDQLGDVSRSIERVEARKDDGEREVGFARERLQLDLDDAQDRGDNELIQDLQAQIEALGDEWARRKIDIEEELFELHKKKRSLEWQHKELEDA